MEGIEWAAIPIVAEMFGIIDIEALVLQLITIRTWQNEQKKED